MKIIYVCSPYRGNFNENIKKAQKACRKVMECSNVPIAPHLYFPQFMNEEKEREIALEMNKSLIEVCDELVIFGSTISEGMKVEIEYARSINKPVMKGGYKDE